MAALAALAERFNSDGYAKAVAARGAKWSSPAVIAGTRPVRGSFDELILYDAEPLPVPLLKLAPELTQKARAARTLWPRGWRLSTVAPSQALQLAADVIRWQSGTVAGEETEQLLVKMLRDVLKRPELRVRASRSTTPPPARAQLTRLSAAGRAVRAHNQADARLPGRQATGTRLVRAQVACCKQVLPSLGGGVLTARSPRAPGNCSSSWPPRRRRRATSRRA